MENELKNKEGYSDPTPHDAFENMDKEFERAPREEYYKYKNVLNVIHGICNITGFSHRKSHNYEGC